MYVPSADHPVYHNYITFVIANMVAANLTMVSQYHKHIAFIITDIISADHSMVLAGTTFT